MRLCFDGKLRLSNELSPGLLSWHAVEASYDIHDHGSMPRLG